jgi:hypothetical protein
MSQVPRLSIVIPCRQADKHFEDTLVSVLQNRPADCEVLVAMRGVYDDPYDLRDEVCFVSAANGASLCELLNIGFQHASGDIIHLLQCGLEVAEGWWIPVAPHFDDASVAAVSPLITTHRKGAPWGTAGIAYDLGGRRRVRTNLRSDMRPEVLGPTLLAGFYRREVIDALQGLDPDLGESVADVDLALRWRQLGCTAEFEPECVVFGSAINGRLPNRFSAARDAESLFWKHAAACGWSRSLTAHAWLVAGETAGTLLRPSQAVRLLGRAAMGLELLFGGRRGCPNRSTLWTGQEPPARSQADAVAAGRSRMESKRQRHVA